MMSTQCESNFTFQQDVKLGLIQNHKNSTCIASFRRDWDRIRESTKKINQSLETKQFWKIKLPMFLSLPNLFLGIGIPELINAIISYNQPSADLKITIVHGCVGFIFIIIGIFSGLQKEMNLDKIKNEADAITKQMNEIEEYNPSNECIVHR